MIAEAVADWRTFDYGGDATMAKLRAEMRKVCERRKKLRAEELEIRALERKLDLEIDRRALTLIAATGAAVIVNGIEGVEGGTIVRVRRTRAVIDQGGKLFGIPISCIRPTTGLWFGDYPALKE